MTPSDEERALLAAVVASPDDDAPRLVYADWLEEHGRAERAEFIRLQVRARAILNDPTRADEWECVRAEARRIDRLFNEAWYGELPHLAGVKWSDFERGLVKSALVRAEASPADFDAACDFIPLTSARMLLGPDADPRPFLSLRVVGRLRTLSLNVFRERGYDDGRDVFDAARVAMLFDVRWPESLRTLYLEGGVLDERAARLLEQFGPNHGRPAVSVDRMTPVEVWREAVRRYRDFQERVNARRRGPR